MMCDLTMDFTMDLTNELSQVPSFSPVHRFFVATQLVKMNRSKTKRDVSGWYFALKQKLHEPAW